MLSGNRNFEGRVNPDVRANYLASPPLVVAYALAGSMNVDITKDPIGYDDENEPVYLSDIWPTSKEIAETVRTVVTAEMFAARYSDVFKGDEQWQEIKVEGGATYGWPMALDLRAEPALFRGHDDDAGAASPTSTDAQHPRAVRRFDHHRPHLARRRHRGRPAPPANTCASTRCRSRSSTPTARAAATMK